MGIINRCKAASSVDQRREAGESDGEFQFHMSLSGINVIVNVRDLDPHLEKVQKRQGPEKTTEWFACVWETLESAYLPASVVTELCRTFFFFFVFRPPSE